MEFNVDDLVWAKMKGFPPWPARIVEPSPDVKAPKNEDNYVFLKFFGTADVAWIQKKDVTPHSESILQDLKDKKKTKNFQQSIDELLLLLDKTEKDKNQSLPKVKEAGVTKRKNAVKKNQSPDNSLISEEELLFLDKTEKDKNQSLPKVKEAGVIKRKPAVKKNQSSDNSLISEEEDTDISEKPKPLLDMDITYGFMGLCPFGRAVLLKLVTAGIKVSLFDSSIDEVMKHIEAIKEITRANSPAELIKTCDVTFCCYEADTKQFADIVHGEDSIIKGFDEAEKLGRKPGYVQLTYIDLKTSVMINRAATVKNAMYLEAPIHGSSEDIPTGKAVINASGHRNLFTKCEAVFSLLSSNYSFLGCNIGISSYTNMALNAATGTINAAISETMTLADKLNIDLSGEVVTQLVEKLFENHNIMGTVERMGNRTCETTMPLKQVQKVMELGLMEADKVNQTMPMAAAANELYKRGKQLNYSDADVSAIYKVIKY